MKGFGSILILSLMVIGCQKDQTAFDLGYDYFPTNVNLTRVYQVTDIFHDIALSPAHDTNHYQIKEVIGEGYIDLEGEEAHELYRYIRLTENDPWQIKDVWTMRRTAAKGEQVEENKRIIKMGFGIQSTTTWDANAENDLGEQNSSYSSLHVPFSISNLNFDSTCTVLHEDFISFVDYRKSFHVYAKHIGCIYQVKKDLRIDNFDTLSVTKGTELIYELISYTK